MKSVHDEKEEERECIFVFFIKYCVAVPNCVCPHHHDQVPTVFSVRHLSCFQTETEGRRCYCWVDLGGPGKTKGRQGSQVQEEALGKERKDKHVSAQLVMCHLIQ